MGCQPLVDLAGDFRGARMSSLSLRQPDWEEGRRAFSLRRGRLSRLGGRKERVWWKVHPRNATQLPNGRIYEGQGNDRTLSIWPWQEGRGLSLPRLRCEDAMIATARPEKVTLRSTDRSSRVLGAMMRLWPRED